MKIDPDDVGLFLGGLFTYLVQQHALDIGERANVTDEQWAKVKGAAFETAFDEVVFSFAEPLKSKLLAQRADFIAHGLRLS